MHKKFQSLLHDYKVNAFQVSHHPEDVKEIARECLDLSKETLNNSYHYHFHKIPDAQRAEFINLVHNYVLEAMLPPIIEKVMMRYVVLEKKHDMTIRLLEKALDILSQDPRSYLDAETAETQS